MLDFTMLHLIETLKYKERYFYTAFCVLLDRGADLDNLQKYIDYLCDDYAENFIDENRYHFQEQGTRSEFMKALGKEGAVLDRGKRLLNAVYEKLKNYKEIQLKKEDVEENMEK